MLCYRPVPVAKNFMDNEEEEHQKVPSLFFFLRVLKNSVLGIV